MRIERLDHLVLTVADIDATVAFYSRVLGLRSEVRDGRHALHFGQQKINLHLRGREFEPKAERPTPGSADLCLVAQGSLEAVIADLAAQGVAIEVGPVRRDGALGSMRSIYLRDPDRNLVEIAVYGDGRSDARHHDQGNDRP